VTVQGRGFPIDEDYSLSLSYDRAEVGFVRGGFEQFRHYYDNSGGFYPFTQPMFALGRELHTDQARAWIEAGTLIPDWPHVTVGYEYQFQKGVKSTLQWEMFTRPLRRCSRRPRLRGIFILPFKDVDEQTHILKLDVDHELGGVLFEDSFRAEFYDLKTDRINDISLTLGQPTPTRLVAVSERQDQFRAANTFRVEKELREWLFLSGGYLYSAADADASFNQNTAHATGIPVSGDYWQSRAIVLSQSAHAFSGNVRLGPWEDLTLSAGVQSEWIHQEGVGRVTLDSGNPATFLLIQPAMLDANLDKNLVQENVALHFTAIPFTSIFAEARLEQERIGQFEDQLGGHHEFIRDTDASTDGMDFRGGFYSSPWPLVSFGGHYRRRDRRSDYDDRVDLGEGGLPGESYPAFIRSRRIETDEVELKATVRPVRWLKSDGDVAIACHRFPH